LEELTLRVHISRVQIFEEQISLNLFLHFLALSAKLSPAKYTNYCLTIKLEIHKSALFML